MAHGGPLLEWAKGVGLGCALDTEWLGSIRWATMTTFSGPWPKPMVRGLPRCPSMRSSFRIGQTWESSVLRIQRKWTMGGSTFIRKTIRDCTASSISGARASHSIHSPSLTQQLLQPQWHPHSR